MADTLWAIVFIGGFVLGEGLKRQFDIGNGGLTTPALSRLCGFTLLSLVLLPVNPLGLSVYATPFDTLAIPGLHSAIQEWQPPDFSQPGAWSLHRAAGAIAGLRVGKPPPLRPERGDSGGRNLAHGTVLRAARILVCRCGHSHDHVALGHRTGAARLEIAKAQCRDARSRRAQSGADRSGRSRRPGADSARFERPPRWSARWR